MFITELSPKYETKRLYDLDYLYHHQCPSFLFLLPLYQLCFFYLFCPYLSSHPKSMCQSFNFLYLSTSTFKMYLPLSLHKKKGTNNSRMLTIIQSIHPSSYLPFFFLIKKDLCNGNLVHSYRLSAMKRVIFFFPFLAHEMSQPMRCARLSLMAI